MNIKHADDKAVPAWIEVASSATVTPLNEEEAEVSGTCSHSNAQAPCEGAMQETAVDAMWTYLNGAWTAALDGDACTNMMPKGAEESVVTLTFAAPTLAKTEPYTCKRARNSLLVGILSSFISFGGLIANCNVFADTMSVYGGVYPGGSKTEQDRAHSDAERAAGLPGLTRQDINKWNVDIQLTVHPAARDNDHSILTVVGMIGVGQEVIVTQLEGPPQHACVTNVDVAARAVDVEFQDEEESRVSASLVSRATTLTMSCVVPMDRLQAGQTLLAFVLMRDQYGKCCARLPFYFLPAPSQPPLQCHCR